MDTVLKECTETQDSVAPSQEPADNQKPKEHKERTGSSPSWATEAAAVERVPTTSKEEIKRKQMEMDILQLNAKCIRYHKNTWKEFASSMWTDYWDAITLIMCEPPPAPSLSYIHSISSSSAVSTGIDEKEISDFGDFRKHVLVPNSENVA